MSFSRRKINSDLARIIKLNGRVIGCYLRNTLPTPARVPTDIYANSPSPDTSNTTLYYIYAVFQQSISEDPVADAGLVGTVKGTLTIPYSYRDILNKTEFFDPYLNGSKFIKDGAALDDQSLMIIQAVKARYLPEIGWVQ